MKYSVWFLLSFLVPSLPAPHTHPIPPEETTCTVLSLLCSLNITSCALVVCACIRQSFKFWQVEDFLCYKIKFSWEWMWCACLVYVCVCTTHATGTSTILLLFGLNVCCTPQVKEKIQCEVIWRAKSSRMCKWLHVSCLVICYSVSGPGSVKKLNYMLHLRVNVRFWDVYSLTFFFS